MEYARNFMEYLNQKRNIPFEVQQIESLEVSHLTENLVLEKAWIE